MKRSGQLPRNQQATGHNIVWAMMADIKVLSISFFYNVCAREIAHKLSPAKFGMNRKRLTHATKLNASVIEVLRSCINFIVPFLKVIRLIRPCIVVKKHPKLRFIWIDDH